MLNKCMIIGHIGADPDMKYLASGAAVTTFSVATNRSWKDADGEKQEQVEWFKCVTWNRLAEVCAQHLTKGRLVYVEGRMQTRTWDDQQGVKRYMTELVAQEVKFLGSRDSVTGAVGAGAAMDGGGDIDPDNLPF